MWTKAKEWFLYSWDKSLDAVDYVSDVIAAHPRKVAVGLGLYVGYLVISAVL